MDSFASLAMTLTFALCMKPTAEAVVGAVQRDPEGLPDTDRARTRLASPDGLIK
jgi:hypothetical protein